MGSMVCPWSTQRWKRFVADTIYNHWFDRLVNGASTKSSLKFLDCNKVKINTPHHLWPTRGCGSRKRVAAGFRAKIITCSYILQSNRARFNQFAVNPACVLCDYPMEDIPHFLLECPALEKARHLHLNKICDLLEKQGLQIPTSRESKCRLLLNCGNPRSCPACHPPMMKPTEPEVTRINTQPQPASHDVTPGAIVTDPTPAFSCTQRTTTRNQPDFTPACAFNCAFNCDLNCAFRNSSSHFNPTCTSTFTHELPAFNHSCTYPHSDIGCSGRLDFTDTSTPTFRRRSPCVCSKLCDNMNILCLDLHNLHTQLLGNKDLEAPRKRRNKAP